MGEHLEDDAAEVTAECADGLIEIGTIARFRSEASLALYLGMATLDNSSGKYRGSKAPKHVNARASKL